MCTSTTEQKRLNRTLTELLNPTVKVYVHLSDQAERTDFMKTAELEGFKFGDGTKPTAREADEVMAINEDKTINFLGFAGSMAFHNATHIGEKQIVKIDFKRYMNGESYYFYGDMREDEQATVNRSSERSPSIGDGSSAFLVYDDNMQENDEFFAWLKQEGFSFWSSSKGWYSGATWKVCWIYVNLNSKLIARGMPGIRVTHEVGNHAVTIEDFKTIYAIYKKYAGLPPLKFE